MDKYAEHADKLGLKYKWWRVGDFRGQDVQLHVIDPTGYAVVYTGTVNNPPECIPVLTSPCKSIDGCLGQGLCAESLK